MFLKEMVFKIDVRGLRPTDAEGFKCMQQCRLVKKACWTCSFFSGEESFINHVDMAGGVGVCQMSILQHKPYSYSKMTHESKGGGGS